MYVCGNSQEEAARVKVKKDVAKKEKVVAGSCSVPSTMFFSSCLLRYSSCRFLFRLHTRADFRGRGRKFSPTCVARAVEEVYLPQSRELVAVARNSRKWKPRTLPNPGLRRLSLRDHLQGRWWLKWWLQGTGLAKRKRKGAAKRRRKNDHHRIYDENWFLLTVYFPIKLCELK